MNGEKEKTQEPVTPAQIVTEYRSELDFESFVKCLAKRAETQRLDFTEVVKELANAIEEAKK